MITAATIRISGMASNTSELRQLGIAIDCGANRRRSRCRAEESVPPLPPRKNLIQPLEPRAPYLDTLEKTGRLQRLRKAKFRFVSDVMHGWPRACSSNFSGAMASPAMKFVGLATRASAAYIGTDRAHVEALRQAVLAGKFDAALCADGDGDRIGAIDRTGTFVNPHRSLHCSYGTWRGLATCRETSPKLFRYQAHRQACRQVRPPHFTKRPSASNTSAN